MKNFLDLISGLESIDPVYQEKIKKLNEELIALTVPLESSNIERLKKVAALYKESMDEAGKICETMINRVESLLLLPEDKRPFPLKEYNKFLTAYQNLRKDYATLYSATVLEITNCEAAILNQSRALIESNVDNPNKNLS